MELSNEAMFYYSMLDVRDLFFSGMLSVDEHNRLRLELFDKYQPQNVIRSYEKLSLEEWEKIINHK